MSYHSSTAFRGASSASAPAPASSGASNAGTLWHRLVAAWLRAYGNRIDANGNIICEL